MQTLLEIFKIAGEIFAFFFIFRFILQACRADYYNPISQSIARITQPPLSPLQKVLPKLGRFDLSPLVMAFAIFVATYWIITLLANASLPFNHLIALAVVNVLNSLLNILFFATIGAVIISWIAPDSPHPAPQIIQQITEPLFSMVRRIIPAIGGLDLSPIVIFIIIRILQAQLPTIS